MESGPSRLRPAGVAVPGVAMGAVDAEPVPAVVPRILNSVKHRGRNEHQHEDPEPGEDQGDDEGSEELHAGGRCQEIV